MAKLVSANARTGKQLRVLNLFAYTGGSTLACARAGVTTGEFLDGVEYFGDGATTHSVVMRSKTGSIRSISDAAAARPNAPEAPVTMIFIPPSSRAALAAGIVIRY